MTTRHVIGYLLLLLLIAGVAFGIWRAIYNSEQNVRRRERRARREKYKQAAARDAPDDEANIT